MSTIDPIQSAPEEPSWLQQALGKAGDATMELLETYNDIMGRIEPALCSYNFAEWQEDLMLACPVKRRIELKYARSGLEQFRNEIPDDCEPLQDLAKSLDSMLVEQRQQMAPTTQKNSYRIPKWQDAYDTCDVLSDSQRLDALWHDPATYHEPSELCLSGEDALERIHRDFRSLYDFISSCFLKAFPKNEKEGFSARHEAITLVRISALYSAGAHPYLSRYRETFLDSGLTANERQNELTKVLGCIFQARNHASVLCDQVIAYRRLRGKAHISVKRKFAQSVYSQSNVISNGADTLCRNGGYRLIEIVSVLIGEASKYIESVHTTESKYHLSPIRTHLPYPDSRVTLPIPLRLQKRDNELEAQLDKQLSRNSIVRQLKPDSRSTLNGEQEFLREIRFGHGSSDYILSDPYCREAIHVALSGFYSLHYPHPKHAPAKGMELKEHNTRSKAYIIQAKTNVLTGEQLPEKLRERVHIVIVHPSFRRETCPYGIINAVTVHRKQFALEVARGLLCTSHYDAARYYYFNRSNYDDKSPLIGNDSEYPKNTSKEERAIIGPVSQRTIQCRFTPEYLSTCVLSLDTEPFTGPLHSLLLHPAAYTGALHTAVQRRNHSRIIDYGKRFSEIEIAGETAVVHCGSHRLLMSRSDLLRFLRAMRRTVRHQVCSSVAVEAEIVHYKDAPRGKWDWSI